MEALEAFSDAKLSSVFSMLCKIKYFLKIKNPTALFEMFTPHMELQVIIIVAVFS
mgnify:CR=1 FL=1